MRDEGCSAVTFPDMRWKRRDWKTVNLLGNVLARQAAAEAGAYEAIFHRDGMVTEGAATNAFMVIGGTLRTFPLSHYILPGITRAVLEVYEDTAIRRTRKQMKVALQMDPFTAQPMLDDAGEPVLVTGEDGRFIEATDLEPHAEVVVDTTERVRKGPAYRVVRKAPISEGGLSHSVTR